MRTLLAGVSVFILYTTASGTAHAQLIYLQDTTTPPVLSYLNKFLNLQPKRSTSAAYSIWNKAFFEWLRNQIEDLPAEDHLLSISYTVEQLEKMSTEKVKQTYNVDKNIALAILKWIRDMVEKDTLGTVYTSNSSDTSQKAYTKKSDNTLYEKEVKEYNGKTYYIYTLQNPWTLKLADFHNDHGAFYRCMYQQCDKVVFESSVNPWEVYVTYGNWTMDIVTLDGKYTQSDDSFESEKENMLTPNKSIETTTTAEKELWEEDLLKELSDLFGDIL